MEPALVERLAVALAIGLVIGAERGFEQREAPAGSRTAGVRTFALTSLLGGLTSSTAVTLAYARLARARDAPVGLLGAGVQLACGVMALRLLAIVGLAAPGLAGRLAAPLAALALVPFAAAAVALRRGSAGAAAAHAELPLGNPLELEAALVWAAALSGLVLLVNGAERALGAAGVYAVAALSGVADVDAVALSLAQVAAAGGRVDPDVAVRAVALAAAVNTGVKAGLCGIVGGRPLARAVAPGLLGGLAAALAMAALR